MIKIKLTDDIRKYANDQVTIKNFGQRSAGFNGSREKQYTGVLGECIVYESLDRALPTYNDGSLIEDLVINNLTVDVKTMARNVDMQDNYVHNFVGYQKDRPCDVLLFNSINKKTRTAEICGWLPKSEFLKKADFFDKGSTRTRFDGTSFVTKAPLYEIKQHKLNQLDSKNNLKNINIIS